jgi:hypothetical protein
MKSSQQIFVATLLTVFAFCSVLYTSCRKEQPATDPCTGISCVNGGICDGGKCICPTGFEGRFCGTTTDPCKNVVCQNGGTCDDGSCTCPTGFSGVNCQILWRERFVGKYTGSETCLGDASNYTLTLAPAVSEMQLTMTNLYGHNFTATCTLTAENSFTFTGSKGSVLYYGTGNMVGKTLSIAYDISEGSQRTQCTFTGSR